MGVQIREVGADALPVYAEIPMTFTVRSVFRVEVIDQGLGGLRLVEEPVEPCTKDCDAYDEDGSPPLSWGHRFDMSNWGFLLAADGDRTVGGTVVALDTPGVDMLEGRRDLAVLWDLRVQPAKRRRGIGSRLFRHATDWARQRGCSQLKIETQNVNVPACRFYAKQGCELRSIDRHGYAGCPEVAHEAMLIWCLNL